MCDAGGGNTSSVAMLTGNKCNNLPAGKQDKDSFRYRNPLDPSRFIWTSFCSVHSLKNTKNMLVKRFLINDFKYISWKVIIGLYEELKENRGYNWYKYQGIYKSC